MTVALPGSADSTQMAEARCALAHSRVRLRKFLPGPPDGFSKQ